MTAPVEIREMASHAEYQACLALQDEIWGAGFRERVPAALLKVAQEIGGVSAGAFDPDGTLLGFVFGLTGIRDGQLVHWSDILAVREGHRGRGIGAKLKAYQRTRVLGLGVTRMYWTFDPLVARNARFNIMRLGARPVAYRPDMYGSSTGSALHGQMPTDRFIVEWDLAAAPLVPGGGETVPGAGFFPLLNPMDDTGVPHVIDAPPAAGYRVQVPRDLAAVQRAGGDLAMRWRLAVREAAAPLFAKGMRAECFVDGGDVLPCYVFTRPHTGGTP
jgi:predicted GNAT superfamily acetyltransferase